MSLKLREKTYEYLKTNPEKRFTARQIAEWMFEKYPKECEEKRQNSLASIISLNTDEALIQQVIAEIGSSRIPIQKKHPQIKTTADKPRHYYYSEENDDDDITSKITSDNEKTLEKQLYPKLSDALFTEYQFRSKRINEGGSKNNRGRNGNKWLHPDIVAIEFIDGDWTESIKSLHQFYGDKRTKIWSFEVKTQIKPSNARESFFQAVSNSTWANYGYLVAEEIDDKAMKDLTILANLHGIGVMTLSEDGIQTLITAKERDIDWNTANRIAEQNPDFKDFITAIEKLLKQDNEYHETIYKKAKFYPIPNQD